MKVLTYLLQRRLPATMRWAAGSPHAGRLRLLALLAMLSAMAAARGDAAGDPPLRLGRISVDRPTGTLHFPGTVNMASGPLEVIVATPRGRLHEALLVADVSPLQLQAMLYALQLSNGPRLPDAVGRQGDLVDLDVSYADAAGNTVRVPIETWIHDTRTGKPMERRGWVFLGSTMRDGAFLAEVEGNICINYSVGATVLDTPDPESAADTLHEVNSAVVPAAGTEVRIIVIPRKKTP